MCASILVNHPALTLLDSDARGLTRHFLGDVLVFFNSVCSRLYIIFGFS